MAAVAQYVRPKIAVLGAGAAGSFFAASVLRGKLARGVRKQHPSVTVFERASRVGGRCCTRDVRGQAVDLGVSSFNGGHAADEIWERALDDLQRKGVVEEWHCRTGRLSAGQDKCTPVAVPPQFRGTRGAAGICEHLLEGADVRCGANVESAWWDGQQWQVLTEGSEEPQEFDWLVATSPFQTGGALQETTEHCGDNVDNARGGYHMVASLSAASRVRRAPQLTVALVWSEDDGEARAELGKLPFDRILVTDSPELKRVERQGPCRLLIHAAPSFAERVLKHVSLAQDRRLTTSVSYRSELAPAEEVQVARAVGLAAARLCRRLGVRLPQERTANEARFDTVVGVWADHPSESSFRSPTHLPVSRMALVGDFIAPALVGGYGQVSSMVCSQLVQSGTEPQLEYAALSGLRAGFDVLHSVANPLQQKRPSATWERNYSL
eukprot:TRINITY_DN3101_c2_g1_i2.p1 TRINITY_DN3101_c2_g1~~TRINITY_DN3101_c2_g1_i2.p1  ORF type:complete len:438 (+),score=130.76 TRINITY_DN3101_c2_g1_i2:41-1354(+)